MDFKNTTKWDLYLSLVIDADAQVHDYNPDELTQTLKGAEPSRYLTINGHIIYPSEKDLGFEVKSVHHNSALTNSDFPLDLSNASDGTTVPVSLVYKFKEFSGIDMVDEANTLNFLTHPGRVIDIRYEKFHGFLDSSRKEFAKKLLPFSLYLEPAKTYLRFFLY